MLVLTKLSLAHAAGATVLAELIGYGLSADGYHPTAPHPEGEGAARAIAAALADSALSAGDVDYINGHGTGTRENDSAESNAVRRGWPRATHRWGRISDLIGTAPPAERGGGGAGPPAMSPRVPHK